MGGGGRGVGEGRCGGQAIIIVHGCLVWACRVVQRRYKQISSSTRRENGLQWFRIIEQERLIHAALNFCDQEWLCFVGNYGAPGGFWYDPWSQDDPIMVMLPA